MADPNGKASRRGGRGGKLNSRTGSGPTIAVLNLIYETTASAREMHLSVRLVAKHRSPIFVADAAKERVRDCVRRARAPLLNCSPRVQLCLFTSVVRSPPIFSLLVMVGGGMSCHIYSELDVQYGWTALLLEAGADKEAKDKVRAVSDVSFCLFLFSCVFELFDSVSFCINLALSNCR